MNKIWNLKDIDLVKVEEYVEKFNVSEFIAKLLISKDIKKDDVSNFLKPDISNLNDPYLLEDMDKIVDRIILAKDKNEKVVIYGDYDVDGITSITLLYSFLKNLGMDTSYYLPDRLKEGYGLNKEALAKLKDEGFNLVITVDCGISAVEEVDYAKSLGLDICITDHHECAEVLPKACATVNPKRPNSKYPFNMLAGVGVTFKVITALVKRLNMRDYDYLKYLDIVAVGTIADIVPLVGENRVITANGLKLLNKTKNYGLKALTKVSGITNIDSDTVSFGLAPRINASGRMADASVAVKMLLSESGMEAFNFAKVLDEQNRLRQEVESKIFKEAEEIIQKEGLENKKTMVIAGNNWHQGVIGIVASKLTEKYMKPVILLTYDDKIAKGSGRIPQGISLYEALTKCSDLLITFGGHELAAGMTLKKDDIEKFKERFEQVVISMKPDDFVKVIDLDLEITKEDLTIENINDINLIAPFGQKNKKPTFVYKNLKVESICTLKDGKHLKLKLKDETFLVDAICFGAGTRRDEIKIGDKIDVVFNLSLNEFMGNVNIQLLLIDFKKSIN